MIVDYNKIADKFSKSRKNMKWEEIDYFIKNYFLKDFENKNVLDIGCGSGRLLEQFSSFFDVEKINYLGIDLSEKMLENARKNFSKKKFLNLNMLDLDKIPLSKSFPPRDKDLFDYIFFIASFHHLDNLQDRLEVLKKAKDLLKENGKIFMTNWALNSGVNKEKYSESIIKNSQNKFGSLDYNIEFGDYKRFYHCFSLDELEYLFKEVGLKIIENRLFENKRNFISIVQK